MSKRLLFDEIRIALSVSFMLSHKEGRQVRKTLDSRRFRDRLRRAVHGAFKGFETLQPVQIRITR